MRALNELRKHYHTHGETCGLCTALEEAIFNNLPAQLTRKIWPRMGDDLTMLFPEIHQYKPDISEGYRTPYWFTLHGIEGFLIREIILIKAIAKIPGKYAEDPENHFSFGRAEFPDLLKVSVYKYVESILSKPYEEAWPYSFAGFGLCYMFRNAHFHLCRIAGQENWHPIILDYLRAVRVNVQVIQLFSEIYKIIPNSRLRFGEYWFDIDEEGWNQRRELIKTAISLMVENHRWMNGNWENFKQLTEKAPIIPNPDEQI